MCVVQWAWSSGCSPVDVSQDESVEHKGTQRWPSRIQGKSEVWSGREQWVWSCEGLVGVVWRKTVCVLETTIGCSTVGITRCSWKGTVGV